MNTASASVSDSDNASADDSDDDPVFFQFRETSERLLGLMPTAADSAIITDLIKQGATVEDFEAGIQWKLKNGDGKPIRYLSKVKPATETAMKQRIQGSNGNVKKPVRKLIGPNGEVVDDD